MSRPIEYVVRRLVSFEFESLSNNQIEITINVIDNFQLGERASFSCTVLDTNVPPFTISSRPNRYEIAENSYGGTVVIGNLLRGDVFEDNDIDEVTLFNL